MKYGGLSMFVHLKEIWEDDTTYTADKWVLIDYCKKVQYVWLLGNMN